MVLGKSNSVTVTEEHRVLVDLKESTGAWEFHTRGLPLAM